MLQRILVAPLGMLYVAVVVLDRSPRARRALALLAAFAVPALVVYLVV